MSKQKNILLLLILLLTFGLRLYRFDYPLADWHSWRQADTAAVSRNFIKRGFDLLRPRFDDLSNVASGLPNPEGYRMVEFPLYNLFHAGLAKAFPALGLVAWGRLFSAFLSTASALFLFLIVCKMIDEKTALWAAFFFAVLPFNVYYGRVILPEPMMVATGLGMIYFFIEWNEKNLKTQSKIKYFYYSLALVFGASTFLLKPYGLVLFLPLAYLVWQIWRLDLKRWLFFTLFCVLSVLPFFWWRQWIRQYPEGIPAYDWLFNAGGIRLKGAWFYWLFAERLAKLILGYWGVALMVLGLVVRTDRKEGLFFFSWLAAILSYFIIIAAGNVRHDYYQVMALPIVCIFLAKGAVFLMKSVPGISRYFARGVLAVVIVFTLGFSWFQVRDYFNINNEAIIRAGQAVDRLLPPEAKVIAPYGGDTAFLFQTNRSGWPVGIEIEKMIDQGATHYVNVNFDEEVDWLRQVYCPLEESQDYIIIDLSGRCET